MLAMKTSNAQTAATGAPTMVARRPLRLMIG
jgi:hypothetical protein